VTTQEQLVQTATAGIRRAFVEFASPYPNDLIYGFVFSCHYDDLEPQTCIFTQQGLNATLQSTLGDIEEEVHPATWAAAKHNLQLSPPDSEFDQLLDETCFAQLQRDVRSLPAVAHRETLVPDALEQALVACRDLGLGITIVCNVLVTDDDDGNEQRLRRLNNPELLTSLGLG